MEEALERAKSKVGGSAALARLLSDADRQITSQAISQWRRVPVERVLEVERATGVSRHELRPDIYPDERAAANRFRLLRRPHDAL